MLGYYLALPFIYLLALLPFRLLYLMSTCIYVLVYYVLGYRKKVVLTNLANAFPQKTEAERRRIARRFYAYLCDLLLETFKGLTFSPKSALRHCRFRDKTVLEQLAAEGRSCIIVLGHYGNWEWAGNTVTLDSRHQLYVIYHPLTNRRFNDLIVHMRTRFGTRLIAMQDTLRQMLKMREEMNATAFIADQTPQPDGAYWTEFLNQNTPVFWGTEKIARKLNLPVVYGSIARVRRGYYEISVEMLCENPAQTEPGWLTEAHTRRLEKDIIHKPELWLWSHRRWKHKRR